MTHIFKKIASDEQFQTFILFLIVVNAMSIGLETVPEVANSYETFFLILDYATQAVFTFEICVRILTGEA